MKDAPTENRVFFVKGGMEIKDKITKKVMKIVECFYGSQPKDGSPNRIEVLPLDKKHWPARDYTQTMGGVFTFWRKLSSQEKQIGVLADAIEHMRDGIDPKQVHTEFMKIEEYRLAISKQLKRMDLGLY